MMLQEDVMRMLTEKRNALKQAVKMELSDVFASRLRAQVEVLEIVLELDMCNIYD